MPVFLFLSHTLCVLKIFTIRLWIIFSPRSFPSEVLEFQPFHLGLLSISTDFNEQCEVRIKNFCLHMNIQLFCHSLVKWQPLSWLNCFSNSVANRLTLYMQSISSISVLFTEWYSYIKSTLYWLLIIQSWNKML